MSSAQKLEYTLLNQLGSELRTDKEQINSNNHILNDLLLKCMKSVKPVISRLLPVMGFMTTAAYSVAS